MSEFWVYTKGLAQRERWIARPLSSLGSAEKTWHFETVLACSANLRRGETPDYETTLYKGPFYVDIDNADIGIAIQTARSVVRALRNVGVLERDIYVWLSGKKGLHITVPMECFTREKEMTRLPWIYGEFAKSLKCGIDTSVYSMGKGRMWRTANMQRENGNYKVAITLDELKTITSLDYARLVSAPRGDHYVSRGTYAPGTSARWEAAVRAAASRTQTAVFVNPEDMELLSEQPHQLPVCGQRLLEGESRAGVGFNSVSMQVGKIISTFAPKRQAELVRAFSKALTGDSYGSEQERESHIRRGLSSTRGYKWSCKTVRSVVQGDPCEHCPLIHLLIEEEGGQHPDEIDWTKKAVIQPLKKAVLGAPELGRQNETGRAMAGGIQATRTSPG